MTDKELEIVRRDIAAFTLAIEGTVAELMEEIRILREGNDGGQDR